jgi:hypothetical protein
MDLRVTKLTVGRGNRNNPPGEDAYYEVETEVECEGELEEARAKLQSILNGWLKTEAQPLPTGLSPDKLNSLPWRSFEKKGEPAMVGEAGWVFADTKGAEDLVEAVKTSKKEVLRLKNFEYSFSGDESQFLNRRPLRARARRTAPSRERIG